MSSFVILTASVFEIYRERKNKETDRQTDTQTVKILPMTVVGVNNEIMTFLSSLIELLIRLRGSFLNR